jgi:hypothetical protein
MVGRPRGYPKSGGRKPGKLNRATIAKAKAIVDSGLSAVEYLQSVYRNVNAPEDSRRDAAKAAAPYETARLSSIEHVGKGGGPIVQRIERLIVDGKDQDS